MPTKPHGQHFLLSAKARTLSIADVARMDDAAVEEMFRRIRWLETGGMPVCPNCDCPRCYDCRRPGGTMRYRCKACGKDFSVTSGTLFASHKMPLRTYLLAIVIFANEVKGKSALALSRDLGVQYRTAFVLSHKLREAMASEMQDTLIGGADRVAEIDGAYFGGHVRPENLKVDRKDRRKLTTQNGKRRCVVVIRERDGRTIAKTFQSEDASTRYIARRVAKETVIHADEGSGWNTLESRYAMKRVNHQMGYSIDGACTNMAESFFSRLRRAEIGHYHHIGSAYIDRYAQEAAWREDHRRMNNGAMVMKVCGLALKRGLSPDFTGYWQRHIQ